MALLREKRGISSSTASRSSKSPGVKRRRWWLKVSPPITRPQVTITE